MFLFYKPISTVVDYDFCLKEFNFNMFPGCTIGLVNFEIGCKEVYVLQNNTDTYEGKG